MDILKKGRTVIGQKMNNNMIQYSVFAGIVFIIIAHPQTFKLVDGIIKVHNKNILLLVHAIVVSLIMYFGSLYLFIPAQKVLLEGVKNKSVWGDLKKATTDAAKKATTDVAKKYAEEKGLPTGFPSGGTDHADAVSDAVAETDDAAASRKMKDIDELHNKWNEMTVEEIVKCAPNPDGKTLGQLKVKCLKLDK